MGPARMDQELLEELVHGIQQLQTHLIQVIHVKQIILDGIRLPASMC